MKPEAIILATPVATPNTLMQGCRMSDPNTKQTLHKNLTSNAGCPIPATYREWVTHRSGALTEATAAVIHLTIFRAGTDAKTLQGQLSTPP